MPKRNENIHSGALVCICDATCPLKAGSKYCNTLNIMRLTYNAVRCRGPGTPHYDEGRLAVFTLPLDLQLFNPISELFLAAGTTVLFSPKHL